MSNFQFKAKNRRTGEIEDVIAIDNGADYTYEDSLGQSYNGEAFNELFEKIEDLSVKEEEISTKLAEPTILIVPSPRIDWCGDCQMEHGCIVQGRVCTTCYYTIPHLH